MPVSTLSETQQASTAATAASAAEPPAASVRRPTSAVAGWPAAIPAGTRFTPFGRLGRTTLARRWLTEVACNGAVVTVAAVVTDALLTVAAVVTDAGLAAVAWSAASARVATRRSVSPSPDFRRVIDRVRAPCLPLLVWSSSRHVPRVGVSYAFGSI